MRRIFDSKFQTEVVFITQGEYYISGTKDILTTTLGSCISVCFYDEKHKVGGMNHYMLPEPAIENDSIHFGKAKYGINSMEMVINEIIKIGARRDLLKAKIFGGANMFSQFAEVRHGVGEQNIQFAKLYLGMEKIPIISEDVGADHARKIYFETFTGHVKLFRLGQDQHSDINREEEEYKKKIVVPTQQEEKKITFF